MFTLIVEINELRYIPSSGNIGYQPIIQSRIEFLQFNSKEEAEETRKHLQKIEWEAAKQTGRGSPTKYINKVCPLY